MSAQGMPRMLRTLLAGASLAALYLVFSQVTRPWLSAPKNFAASRQQQLRASGQVPRKRVSPVFAEAAEKWFPGDAWVRSANGRVRDGGRLLFFQEHRLINEGRSLQASPVAMLWQGSEAVPITATADSAQLDAEVKISLGESAMGRLTSGLLSGEVRISGPKGLLVEGRSFHYSAEALKIWTSQPVRIFWDGHTAMAEGGAEIELLGGDDTAKSSCM